jgi:mannitol-1-phosphate 5-dehydrogenase
MKLTLFGAGKIGRSFIAPVFAAGGYAVTFVDVDRRIVNEINNRREYQVVLLAPDGSCTTRNVSGVDALDASDRTAVGRSVAGADLVATAVGVLGFPTVCGLIATGVELRGRERPGEPLDVILAENIPGAAAMASELIQAESPSVSDRIGLVETSIGKMVPIMPARVAREDPLLVHAEPYNTLIVDKRGFRGEVPAVADLLAVDNIRAYVHRKLYVHNLGHAAVAYLGYAADPATRTIAEAVERPDVRKAARGAMLQSVRGLCAEYPDVFDTRTLEEHVADLLRRFNNRALGDTVFRVGQDLSRKLGPGDRVVGALDLLARHNLPLDSISAVYAAALGFAARDEDGNEFAGDALCRAEYRRTGLNEFMSSVSGLHGHTDTERRIMTSIEAAFRGRPNAVPDQARR